MGNDSFDARPYLMENSPSVLSMGKRCMTEGFCFLWIKGFDPCALTPSGDLVPFTVVNGVPYFESRKLLHDRRDRLTDLSSRCGVAVRNGRLVISVGVNSQGVVACPGPSGGSSSSAQLGADDTAGGDGVGSAGGQAESDDREKSETNKNGKSKTDKDDLDGEYAEGLSESEDSIESIDVPEDGMSEVDNMSEADSDASVTVR